MFLALSVTLFVYEISREPLNGFAPNSQGKRVWSIAYLLTYLLSSSGSSSGSGSSSSSSSSSSSTVNYSERRLFVRCRPQSWSQYFDYTRTCSTRRSSASKTTSLATYRAHLSYPARLTYDYRTSYASSTVRYDSTSGFTSPSTQNRSFGRRSSQPVSWLVLKRLNETQRTQT